MSLSLYDASVAVYLRMLRNLSAMLGKAETHANETGGSVQAIVEARLAPDMLPLSRQIQMVSDGAKFGAARLAGLTPPPWEDTETTLPELQDRLARTIAYVEGVGRDQIDGQEDREIVLKFPSMTLTFSGKDFVTQFSMPNFLFHVVTAYGIMRGQGVSLGKMDYLAPGTA